MKRLKKGIKLTIREVVLGTMKPQMILHDEITDIGYHHAMCHLNKKPIPPTIRNRYRKALAWADRSEMSRWMINYFLTVGAEMVRP